MSKLRVFSPSYNSHKFCINCIDSVAAQTKLPDEHFFIDDSSPDDTREWLSKHYTRMQNNASNKYDLNIVVSQVRKWKLLNLYEYVIKCDPEDVICVLDGDDWLADKTTLEKVWKEYQDPHVDYVYTNWKYSHNGEIGISKQIPENFKNWDPYSGQWVTSAMSTFRVKQFLKIPITNFFRWDHKWFTMGNDQAYVLPIIHQIMRQENGYNKIKFIDEPLYVYQFTENPNKPRTQNDGGMRQDAHDSVTYIRQRGYIR
ncbi:MAG: glycosyltransferase [Rhodobacteraceae bacterium]|nr:glycosyltransferase [Paracoccaceae bacterium]